MLMVTQDLKMDAIWVPYTTEEEWIPAVLISSPVTVPNVPIVSHAFFFYQPLESVNPEPRAARKGTSWMRSPAPLRLVASQPSWATRSKKLLYDPQGLYRGSKLYRDNGKEHGGYYLGLRFRARGLGIQTLQLHSSQAYVPTKSHYKGPYISSSPNREVLVMILRIFHVVHSSIRALHIPYILCSSAPHVSHLYKHHASIPSR